MAIVKKYLAEVISIEKPFKQLYTVKMRAIDSVFKYSPGQFLHLALDEYDPSSGWPESRCFSMQSNSKDEFIKITYAVKGAFTKRMENELNIGSMVTLKLPYGDLFSQDHSQVNTIFIAGGTGITPFLSLFNDASFVNYSNPILYAGFREQKLNIYSDEINLAKNNNSSLIVNCIYQDKKGILNIAKILKSNDINRTFFISGPPVMIKNFKNYLIENGVFYNQIKTDDWE